MIKAKYVATLSIILVLIFSTSAFAAGVGVVNTDVLNFRAGPGTNYQIIGQLTKGQIVQIVEHVNSEWSKVSFNDKTGFIATRYINIRNEETSRSASISGVIINQDGYVTASALNFRTQPSVDAAIIVTMSKNTNVRVLENVGNGWGKIQYNNQIGYASLEYIALGTAPEPASKSQELLSYAKQFLGKPYSYGGNGPNSFDCSGFVKFIFANFGISLPRTTYEQVNLGYYVAKNDLLPGDLVFFKQGRSRNTDHVGIYIGDGQFIHASSPGDVVKYDTINSGYYCTYYYTGRRVL